MLEKKEELNVADAMLLASGLFDDGHYEKAAELFTAAREAGGGFRAINGLAVCLNEMDRHDEAMPLFDEAYGILRGEILALTANRAKALQGVGRAEEALTLYDGLVKAQPAEHLKYGRALALLELGRYEETIAECNKLLSNNPHHDLARFARGFAELVLGDYKNGFADYECRMKRNDVELPDAPIWTGEQSIAGKTVLVHGEMGFGDNIMFMRYVAMMLARGARVIVVVPESQQALVPEGAEYRNLDQSTWPKIDYWIWFMSLAHAFRTTRETVPLPVPLVFNLIDKWHGIIHRPLDKGREFIKGPSLKVGLCWSGKRASRYDQHRSVPLAELGPLFSLPNVTFYSLQLDVRERDRPAFASAPLIDLAPHLKTFEDTANAMACLDLMITCDTSVAHLAGTVGVPTWVMLTTFRTYWLWIQKITSSPWYPSVKVFRQETDGDWKSVVAQIVAQLDREIVPAERACS